MAVICVEFIAVPWIESEKIVEGEELWQKK